MILTDTGANSSLVLLGTQTSSIDTTASVYQKGAIIIATATTAGASPVYINTGTTATPVWSPIPTASTPTINGPNIPLFLLDNGPSGGVIVVTAYASGTSLITASTGTMVAIRVKNAISAGAVTINFNGTTKNLKKHTANNNITTPYAAGGTIWAVYTPGQFGGVWQSLSDN